MIVIKPANVGFISSNNGGGMKKIYETDRLILKTLSPGEADQALKYYTDNKEFLAPFEPLRDPIFYTLTEQEKCLREDMINAKMGQSIRFWIYLKNEKTLNRPIGNLAFSNIVAGVFLNAFVGYKLDGQYLNKGYMTEALKKGVTIMFTEFGLHRLEANIMPRNIASLSVAKKVGFYEEGLAKKYLRINGVWEDHNHMVIRNIEME
jgi:ribosomal-protein-alanine N-acetyltransferase